MHDILRERILRKLEVLPEQQLYEVLDYIEFLETKYAADRARRPDTFQRFAERLEDSMRMRSVAPRVINGTLGLFGTAQKVIRGVQDAGRDILGETGTGAAPPAPRTRPQSGGNANPGETNGR